MSYKEHFSRFISADPERLHFAAHSHQYWPDVTFEAHVCAWRDAAQHVDRKWEGIMAEVLPKTRAHIARVLDLSDPDTIALGSNTHSFVLRLFSTFESRTPIRVLTTDGEFHSFNRQCTRMEEAGLVQVERIATEPFATFEERFLAAAQSPDHDFIYVSQVFFDSGFVFGRLEELARTAAANALIAIDGYHGFMALPTSLAAIESRCFYLAGGYKYAMSGEGACFMHCPPSVAARPVDTGWFAGFDALESAGGEELVGYGEKGSRFMGATLDPTPFYRFNAVQDLWQGLGVSVADIHRHVRELQQHFLGWIGAHALAELPSAACIPPPESAERGHFVTFRLANAAQVHDRLFERGVLTDYRGDRLRFGFAIYHDLVDVRALCERLATCF